MDDGSNHGDQNFRYTRTYGNYIEKKKVRQQRRGKKTSEQCHVFVKSSLGFCQKIGKNVKSFCKKNVRTVV